MNEAVGRLLAALERAGVTRGMSPDDVADALWLACRISGSTEGMGGEAAGGSKPPAESPAGERPAHAGAGLATSPPLRDGAAHEARPAERRDADASRQTLDVRVASTAAPAPRMAMAAALRRALPRVATEDPEWIDEEASARRIAAESLVEPVPLRAWRSYFEVALLVDEGPTMLPWRGAADGLERALRQSGSFRDVRSWLLRTEGVVSLRAGLRRPGGEGLRAAPRTIADPTGRRLILVYTDCAGAGWHDGSVHAVLAQWARWGPVALVQALPKALWRRTALARAAEVRLEPGAPFAANARFAWEHDPPLPRRMRKRGFATGTRFPVVPLDEQAMGRFARLLGGVGHGGVPGAMWTAGSFQAEEGEEEAATATAAEHVQRFRERVSPVARQLAALLAAAAPLTLSTIRLVRGAMLPEASVVHEAELLLGGILQVAGGDAGADGEATLDFAGGDPETRSQVRALLLNDVSAYDALEVLSRLAEQDATVGPRLRLVLDGAPDARLLQRGASAFESVAAQVFLHIGGKYAARTMAPERAPRVVQEAVAPAAPPAPVPTTRTAAPDVPPPSPSPPVEAEIDDFEVSIVANGKETFVDVPEAGRFPFETEWSRDRVEEALADRGSGVSPKMLEQLGIDLFVSLFPKGTASIFRQRRAAARDAGRLLRLRVRTSLERVQPLPWELLIDPEGYGEGFLALSPQITLVRSRTDSPSFPRERPRSRLSVLAVTGDEVSSMSASLLRATLAGLDGKHPGVMVTVQSGVNSAMLRQDFSSPGLYDVLHFVGGADAETGSRGNVQQRLRLTDGLFDRRELGEMLARAQVRLAVLDAPHTDWLARSLVRYIPAAIGLRELGWGSPGPLRKAGPPSYEALYRGAPLDVAVGDWRRALHDESRPGGEWYKLVFYLQRSDGAFFDPFRA